MREIGLQWPRMSHSTSFTPPRDFPFHSTTIKTSSLTPRSWRLESLVEPSLTRPSVEWSIYRIGPEPNHSMPTLLHRTQSLDYGVVLAGTAELLLDSGERILMHRGDVAVQRGTLHGWRNPSKVEWTRIFSVLVYSQKLVVAGKTLEEESSVVFDPKDLNPRD